MNPDGFINGEKSNQEPLPIESNLSLGPCSTEIKCANIAIVSNVIEHLKSLVCNKIQQ